MLSPRHSSEDARLDSRSLHLSYSTQLTSRSIIDCQDPEQTTLRGRDVPLETTQPETKTMAAALARSQYRRIPGPKRLLQPRCLSTSQTVSLIDKGEGVIINDRLGAIHPFERQTANECSMRCLEKVEAAVEGIQKAFVQWENDEATGTKGPLS